MAGLRGHAHRAAARQEVAPRAPRGPLLLFAEPPQSLLADAPPGLSQCAQTEILRRAAPDQHSVAVLHGLRPADRPGPRLTPIKTDREAARTRRRDELQNARAAGREGAQPF